MTVCISSYFKLCKISLVTLSSKSFYEVKTPIIKNRTWKLNSPMTFYLKEMWNFYKHFGVCQITSSVKANVSVVWRNIQNIPNLKSCSECHFSLRKGIKTALIKTLFCTSKEYTISCSSQWQIETTYAWLKLLRKNHSACFETEAKELGNKGKL